MDTAIVTTRLIGQDAISNFTMASAEALKRLGKVSVYAFAYERPMADGVDVRYLGGYSGHSLRTNVRAALATSKLARELSGYDVLLIVNPDVGSMPAYHLARRHNPGLKVVWTFHGLTPVPYVSGFRDRLLMRLRKAAYVKSMRRADAVQVFSEYVKKEATGWGIPGSKLVVMPFGVDTGRMAAGDGRRVREKYGVGDEFLLLYVGRLAGFKHVDDLIRAIAMLEGPALVVVGGGPEKERLEALAKELHVVERVRFAGRVPDDELPDYYAACDAWATASRHEGFCVPIVEALAAGKPVIVPDVAAMPETAGEAGRTYPPGDVKALAEAVASMASEAKAYGELSGKARARASAYSLDDVMASYVEFVRRQVECHES
jgi:glycosyltransferase involved in cell wall biosynthesis